MKLGSNNSLFAGEGARLLGFKAREDVEDNGRESGNFLPPLPRARLGVADLEPGGVSPGDGLPEAVFVVVDPNSSNRLSSYLRCFSSRSFTARALCSSMVGFVSSASSEDKSPFTPSDVGTGVFLESKIGGGLKLASAFTPRVSRK